MPRFKRLSTNALAWLAVAASALWLGYEGWDYSAHRYQESWWNAVGVLFLPAVLALCVRTYGAHNGWNSVASTIDPIRWKPEHQMALIVAAIVGALAGLFYGLSRTQHSQGIVQSEFFWVWLQNVSWYWPWPTIGAALAAMAAYLVRLLRA